jgi:hypothetical protein
MSNGNYEDVSGTYDPGETAASEDVDPLDAFFAEMIQNQRDEEERNRLLAQMRAEEAQMTQPTTPAPTQGPTPWDPSKERSMGELMGTQFAPPQTGTTPPPMGINRGGQQYPLTPPVPPPNTTPLSSPTARMYMGPNISDSEVRALVPPGMSMNLMPSPTPDQSEGAAGRVAAMTAPKFRYGEPTLTSIDPASRQFAARQAIQQMVSQGTPLANAMQQFPEFLSQTGQRPMTDYQREALRLREEDIKRKTANAEKPKPLPPPKATQAVHETFQALNKKQAAFEITGDLRKARQAQIEKDAFVRQHPELGLKPELDTPPATGTAAPAPAAAPPAAMALAAKPPTSAPQKVTSKAEFDALPRGAIYTDSNGKRFRKP